MGAVTEFGFSDGVGRGFGGKLDLVYLKTIAQNWGLLPSKAALLSIDNHDNQRSGNPNILTYKSAREYKMAVAFMLAYPYGIPRVMSSYFFDSFNQGPPSDVNGNLISPTINSDGSCGAGYVCEHRWTSIYGMIGFKNVTADGVLKHWWDNSANQIAFARFQRGFVAFNRDIYRMDETLQTSLPKGWYCDVITGEKRGQNCTGRKFYVDQGGLAEITIDETDKDGVVAFHVLSKVDQSWSRHQAIST